MTIRAPKLSRLTNLWAALICWPCLAQSIDDWDDSFDGVGLDSAWLPSGDVGDYSYEVTGGFLHVTVPGSITQGSPGKVASFIRSGPPAAQYPEWWADLRVSHDLLRGVRHGAVGWFLAAAGGFIAPERLANAGFDGVFPSNSATFIEGDDNPTAQSNPIILRIHRKPDQTLTILYKSDTDQAFTQISAAYH